MNIAELTAAMPYIIQAKIPVCLIAPHGRGKTSFFRKYAKDAGYDTFIYLKMSAREPGELIGMMHLAEVNEETAISLKLDKNHVRKTQFALPDWFPTNPAAKVFIFLDEINRAPRYALQPLFEMMTERSLNGVGFPEHTAICAAANPESGDYVVTEMADLAWTSRFCTIDFAPTTQEWLQYAKNKGMNPSVAAFIAENPNRLEGKREKYNVTQGKSPDPRAWDWISDFRNLTPPSHIEHEVIQGLIGPGDAVLYLAFSKEFKPIIRSQEIMNEYDKVQHTVIEYARGRRLDLLKTTVDEILVTDREVLNGSTPVQINNMRRFILDIPRDLGAMFVFEIFSVSRTIAEALCEDVELTEHFKNRDYKIIEKDATPESLVPEEVKTAKKAKAEKPAKKSKKSAGDDLVSSDSATALPDVKDSEEDEQEEVKTA